MEELSLEQIQKKSELEEDMDFENGTTPSRHTCRITFDLFIIHHQDI